jgi:hypothetical protein
MVAQALCHVSHPFGDFFHANADSLDFTCDVEVMWVTMIDIRPRHDHSESMLLLRAGYRAKVCEGEHAGKACYVSKIEHTSVTVLEFV